MASASTSENVTGIKAAAKHARGQSADVVDGYEAGGLGAGRHFSCQSRHHAHSNNIDLGEQRHNQRMKSDREPSSLDTSITPAPVKPLVGNNL